MHDFTSAKGITHRSLVLPALITLASALLVTACASPVSVSRQQNSDKSVA
jgi:hypothetical protein